MKHIYRAATIAAVCSLSFLLATHVFAAVDHIAFINTPQTIVVGQSSTLYQIQLQDSTNAITTASSTVYVTFPFNFGSFSSQTGTVYTASSSVYISTGDSNKYFYFTPNTVGDFNMIINANSKNNMQVWQVQQGVNVIAATDSNTSTTSDDNDATSSYDTATSTATTTSVTQIVYISSHSSATDLSNLQITPVFSISAGRERIASVNEPLQFSAQWNTTQNLSMYTPVFTWSFGDGTSAAGKDATHIYKYPGDYTVVLNGTCNGINAVSRTTVHVTVPDIMLLAILSGDVQVINNSDTEINLGGWKLKSTFGEFIFPVDTIILSGKNITLAHEDSKIQASTNDQLSLIDPSGTTVATANFIGDDFTSTSTSEEAGAVIEQNLAETIQKAESLAALLKKYHTSAVAQNPPSTSSQPVAVRSLPAKSNQVPQNQNVNQAAAVVESINPLPQATSSRGFWAKLFSVFHF